MAKKKAFDPYDTPSIQRVREIYVGHMRRLMAEQRVSSIDELAMSPEAKHVHGMLSRYWREALTSD
jgi:hypothetical protein